MRVLFWLFQITNLSSVPWCLTYSELCFLMQHPWSKTIRLAVDLEAMGVGGKSGIFQVLFSV